MTMFLEEQVHAALWKVLDKMDGYGEVEPIKARKSLTQERLVQAIYQKLMSAQFCRRRPDDPSVYLAAITHAVGRGEPISCILGHGPLKNQNNCSYSKMDWAELFAFAQLMKLAKAVRAIYPPGLSVSLFVDDARSEYANRISSVLTDSYRESLSDFIVQSPLSALISDVVSLKALYQTHHHEAHLLKAEKNVWARLSDPCNQDVLLTYYEHARRNLVFEPDMPLEEKEALVRESAHRYLVSYEAEKPCGFWNRPNVVYMRYSPHPGFYQMFTLRRGSVSQPWQGEGGLLLTSGGKLDPCVLTRSKRQKGVLLGRIETPLSAEHFSSISVFAELAEPIENVLTLSNLNVALV